MPIAYHLYYDQSQYIDILRFRVVGVHVTQFKHQLSLQDQLEVEIQNPKKDLLHFHFPTDRSEHDSLVSRDAGPLPRTLRTLPPSQTWSHHFAHLHQPHQVNIAKVVRKQDKLKTLNSERKHQ